MVAVDMGVDPVQAFENCPDRALEVRREGNAGMSGKHRWVGQMVRGPSEEVGNVCWRGKASGFGKVRRVVPQIFEFIGGFHLGAGLWGAEFGDGTVEEVDLVIEVDDCVELAGVFDFVFVYPGRASSNLPFTASHSSRSSPSGSWTTLRKLPLPRVASANCLSCQLLVPRARF